MPENLQMERELPAVLPVFPLTGVLLLPGNFLPLNVFEPRYRNLVADVMAAHRAIGMIQPRTPQADNAGPGPDPEPELYAVGCLGRVDRCEPQADGRYLIVLKGETRFAVRRELEPRRGYRRVEASYREFGGDLAEHGAVLDRSRLLAAVDRFSRAHDLEFDRDLLAALPCASLVNALAAALPFTPVERQALLEAAGVEERQQLLRTLLEMEVGPAPAAGAWDSPPVH